MAFAVLLMNSLTPVIDQYTRRGASAHRRGEPLPANGTHEPAAAIHAAILGAFCWASAPCSP